MTVCPGCYRSFAGQSSFFNHVTQSQNERCARVWEDLCELPVDALQVSESDEDFEDYFGDDYGPEDFPGFEDVDMPEADAMPALAGQDEHSDTESESETDSELNDESDTISEFQAE